MRNRIIGFLALAAVLFVASPGWSFSYLGRTSGIGSAGVGVWSGGAATVTQGSTDYLAQGSNGNTSAQGTQATAMVAFPMSGVAYGLYCANATGADNSTGVTYTVYGGAAGTTAETLTCASTNAGTGVSCNDTTHAFTVTAGDLLNVKVVNGNSAAASGVTSCSFMVRFK